jgi:hypothetical protein
MSIYWDCLSRFSLWMLDLDVSCKSVNSAYYPALRLFDI